MIEGTIRLVEAPMATTASTDDLLAAFGRCRGRGYVMALHITGVAEDAADVVQEAYLAARRHLSGYRGEGALEAWLLKIVVNRALRVRRRRGLLDRVAQLLAREPSAPGPAADWLVGCSEELRWLGRALGRLPARQRAAFVLRHAHELPLAEVARLMGLSVPTVKTHLLRATERLRREAHRSRR